MSTQQIEKYKFKNIFMTRHLGVDEKLVDLVIERAKEVEQRRIDICNGISPWIEKCQKEHLISKRKALI